MSKKKGILKILVGAVAVIFVLFVLISTDNTINPIVVGDEIYNNPVTGEPGIAQIQDEGWSAPVKLQVSDGGWEDSTYITRDGKYVLFFYHPAEDFFTNKTATSEIQVDGKLYYSERPFVTKKLHPVSKPGVETEAGPYIALNEDFYFVRTLINFDEYPPVYIRNAIFRNDQVLDLGTGFSEGNPHYCDAMAELYFNFDNDRGIGVSKDGKTTILPEPINILGTQNFQPFLTDDCQTMYFTSTRDATWIIFPLQIYKSQRLGEFEWSKPELFISYPPQRGGVGEFSMTRDNKQMVFLQLTILPNDEGRTDMFYSEKK